MTEPERLNTDKTGLIFGLLILVIFLSGSLSFWSVEPKGLNMLLNWLIVIFSMIGLLGVIGKNINGRFSGVFINERKKITLSRFQLVMWTLIILSAFVTIALERVFASAASPQLAIAPLDIALPPELWVLIGISVSSLVGSPLILNTKPKKNGATYGILAFNRFTSQANWSDMFKGDEDGNEQYVDMAKVQMFFFTLIVAFSYMILLVSEMITKAPVDFSSFPVLSQGAIAILGISNAGYLGNKTFNHTTPEQAKRIKAKEQANTLLCFLLP